MDSQIKESQMKNRPEISEELAARGFMSEEQTRRMLNLSPGTLRVWRSLDKGPTFYKIGKTISYRTTDVEQWVEAQAHTPTQAVAA
jgi:hypothetical protein